jgi:hypothetical protein
MRTSWCFALPFATPVAALRITPQGSNVLVPIRVLGRNNRKQPWSLLATAVVYRLTTAGKEQGSGPVELQGASVREVKIEADAKTPGFASAPDIVCSSSPRSSSFWPAGRAPSPWRRAGRPGGRCGRLFAHGQPDPGLQGFAGKRAARRKADVSKADVTGSAGARPAGRRRSRRRRHAHAHLVLWGILLLGALRWGHGVGVDEADQKAA